MKNLSVKIQEQFNKMASTGMLFRSTVPGSKVWETYLNSFTPEQNPVYRDPNSSTYNCNHCNNFIRRYGNIVAVNEKGELESIFSNLGDTGEYNGAMKACSELLKDAPIGGIFKETFNELSLLPYEKVRKTQSVFRLGISHNHKEYTQEEVDKYGNSPVVTNKVYTFHHFHLDMPAAFVDMSGDSLASIEATYRDKYSVFKRAMEEIPLDTLELVEELIIQGSLLDGESHLYAIIEYKQFKKTYVKLRESDKDNWCWAVTYAMSEGLAKFKNTLIGVLCTELAEGMELNKACENWNKRVDPVNYHKAKAPITEAQKKRAQKFVEENGYVESFNRRLATIDDIKASEILHINRDNNKKSVSIFDSVPTASGKGRHKRSEFDKVEEVGIDKFMADILPKCTSVEVLLENRMEGNLVNLTTAAEDSKQIFKWDNPFSYTFNGNLAGKSMIKENVKTAGGKTDGVLRFSIQWNDEDTPGIVDLDAHAKEQFGSHIYYSTYKGHPAPSSGMLDVDMIRPSHVGVENIVWTERSYIPDGEIEFIVRNYCGSNNRGFKAEIEFDGEVYNYYYPQHLGSGGVLVATISIHRGVMMSIKHNLPEINQSKNLWGLDTGEFHKVNMVCLTPNHWGEHNVGNKHYLFMLSGCANPDPVRGFHNEHLIPELLQHRKVLDVLGNTALIEPTKDQLAGVGFNATVRDEVILRLSGSFKRVIKVKF